MVLILANEKISFYSHFGGFIFAVIGTVFLLSVSLGSTPKIVISLVYGLSVMFLFLASSLYHALKKEENDLSVWRKLDHIAIFFMIAGTYTPVTYLYLSGYWRWVIIIIQWIMVLGGFFFKFFYLNAPRYLYTSIYLVMGWVGIIALKMFLSTMPPEVLFLIVSGGLSFTIGAVIYMLKKPKIIPGFGFHEIFHLFILLGASLHYLAVFRSIIL